MNWELSFIGNIVSIQDGEKVVLRWLYLQINLQIQFNFIKILAGFFAETDEFILKFVWKFKRLDKTLLKKNNKV